MKRSAKHLAWLRRQPCVVPGCIASPCEASHLRTAANSGMGIKPADDYAVPMCAYHHRTGMWAYHTIGHRAFEEHFKLNLFELAAKFAGREK